MLKIYLDNCCYNRPFDDLSREEINDEATAKMFIQSLVKYKCIALYYSFMSQAELDDSPFEDSKAHIGDFIRTSATAFIGDKSYRYAKSLNK